MNSKNVVIGALVAALIYDGVVSHRNKKLFTKQRETIKSLKLRLVKSEELRAYLASKLDDYEIPVTEFDMIVANY